MIIFLIKNVSKMYFGPIDSVSNFYVWIGIFSKISFKVFPLTSLR